MPLRNIFRRKKRGFTIVELMVAMAVNVVLIGALVKVFSANLGNYNQVVAADTLNQQLQIAMDLMVNDIRRAGYWGLASSAIGTGTNSNPYQASGTDITTNATNNCILFAYDYNSNGTLPTISSTSDDERYGYRLVSSTLQARPSGATYSCTATTSNWDDVTNPELVTITALSFTIASVIVPVGATSNYLQIRTVTISITGQVAGNSGITRTLTEAVRIRNDKFV